MGTMNSVLIGHARLATAGVCLLAASSCFDSQEPLAPAPSAPGQGEPNESTPKATPTPRIEYRFEPWDMMTAVGDSPIRLIVAGIGGASATDEQLSALSAAVRLRSWPELAELPAKVTVQTSRKPNVVRLVVEPAAKLTDRWYALAVTKTPEGIAPAEDPANAFVAPDGTRVARFRIGSEPLLVSLRESAAVHETNKYVVSFDFSERVKLSGGTGKGLALTAPGGDTSGCVPDKDTGDSFRILRVTCPKKLLVPGARLSLAREGLRSMAGLALRGVQTEFGGDQIVPAADGGRFVRLGLAVNDATRRPR
jgi:virulence-associated protein VagC